jgi:hypothetical protein
VAKENEEEILRFQSGVDVPAQSGNQNQNRNEPEDRNDGDNWKSRKTSNND